MHDTRRSIERLRDAVCLAHAIPGVALRLRSGDHEVLVSATCLAAALDPCRFRGLVIAASAGRVGPFARFDEVDVAGGLVHLGGGLYQPSHPGSTDDRWFVSALGHEQVVGLLSECPLDASDAFSVVVRPDADLRRSAIRVRCEDRHAAAHLDEVAMWAMSACLIEELTTTASIAPSRPER